MQENLEKCSFHIPALTRQERIKKSTKEANCQCIIILPSLTSKQSKVPPDPSLFPNFYTQSLSMHLLSSPTSLWLKCHVIHTSGCCYPSPGFLVLLPSQVLFRKVSPITNLFSKLPLKVTFWNLNSPSFLFQAVTWFPMSTEQSTSSLVWSTRPHWPNPYLPLQVYDRFPHSHSSANPAVYALCTANF